MYILNNPQRCKMVGCWLGYIHCLVAKNPICTGKLQPFYFSSPLASYITSHVRQWKVIGIYNSFLLCTFLVLLHFYFYIQYITFRLLHFCHYQATSLRFTVGSR